MTHQSGFDVNLFQADVLQSVKDLLDLQNPSSTFATVSEACHRLSGQAAFLASSQGDIYWGTRKIRAVNHVERYRLQAEIAMLWQVAVEMTCHETVRSCLGSALSGKPNDVFAIAKASVSAVSPFVIARTIQIDLNPLLFALFSIAISRIGVEAFSTGTSIDAADLERVRLQVPEITFSPQEGDVLSGMEDVSLFSTMITDSPLALLLRYFPSLRHIAEDLQIAGLGEPAVFTLVKAIARLESHSTIVSSLKKALMTLQESKLERAAVQRTFVEKRQNGEFSRSILSVQSTSGTGTAFVIGEVNRYYILISNSHVVGNAKSVLLQSCAPEEEEIGTASVLLINRMNFPETGDLAILVINEASVRGGGLLRIDLAVGRASIGQYATLVSGRNSTISTGVLVTIPESSVTILLGAETIPGDSGSPYLVETNGGYKAVAVNAKIGALGMLLNREVIEDMLRAF